MKRKLEDLKELGAIHLPKAGIVVYYHRDRTMDIYVPKENGYWEFQKKLDVIRMVEIR